MKIYYIQEFHLKHEMNDNETVENGDLHFFFHRVNRDIKYNRLLQKFDSKKSLAGYSFLSKGEEEIEDNID